MRSKAASQFELMIAQLKDNLSRLPFGERVGELQTSIPGPQSKELAKRLTRVEAPGITSIGSDFPVFWERALGSNVQDVDGNVFVDLCASFGVCALGHSPASIVGALEKQANQLPHGMGDVHPASIKVELLERLSNLFPGKNGQSILCSSGAEAVESALKTARLISGRPGVISFHGSYHGLTYGTLAVGGQSKFKEPFSNQIASFTHFASYPNAQSDPSPMAVDASIYELEEIFRMASKGPNPIGAIILEPIQGRAGVIQPPSGWLKAVREWCDLRHVVMIVDEIMTGFGRTGTRFAVDHERVRPDLLCVGKALSGVLPFSACIGREETMKGWPWSNGEALHTSTFLGNPLGCAAALASLQAIEQKELAHRARRLGNDVMSEIEVWKKNTTRIKNVRGQGLMIGIELDSEGHEDIGFEVTKRALARGVILLPSGEKGKVLSLTPPLVIGGRQLQWSLDQLRDILLQFS